MKTHEYTTTTYYIQLGKDERFTVEVPRAQRRFLAQSRPWYITMVSVKEGFFTLYGDTNPRRANLHEFPGSYLHPSDVPGIPAAVAAEIERLLGESIHGAKLGHRKLPQS